MIRSANDRSVASTEYSVLGTQCAALLILSVVVLPQSLPGADQTPRTIHVSSQGEDKSNASKQNPIKTLKQALAVAQSGDTIRLAPGLYAGEVKTRLPGVTIEGPSEAIIASPSERAIQVLHDKTTVRGLTFENCDIAVWIDGASDCLLERLTIRDTEGEAVRIKNQSCRNLVRKCTFLRMGREGFNAAAGRKNGEGIYIGTAPEQRNKNTPPNVPDRCTGNLIEDCTFKTEAAEAIDIKEDCEDNIVRRCTGENSRDPDGAIFGSRGDRNLFEHCVARGGLGHGFRFGGDTVKKGRHGQAEERTYGANNVLRNCRAENNSLWGAAPMVQPQDIDATNAFTGNGKGAIRK